jgi:very-short-patch-repair endonuclease
MRSANLAKTALGRKLRRESTVAELKLWNRLRSRALAGFKFVRQEPIGRYVVDFVCREQRLVIEPDGGQHAESERDTLRDRWLADRRYRVLRFWNNDVISNIDGVLETIATALEAGIAPSPGSLTRSDLSPQAGRGDCACAIALPDLATPDGEIRWQTRTMRKPPL